MPQLSLSKRELNSLNIIDSKGGHVKCKDEQHHNIPTDTSLPRETRQPPTAIHADDNKTSSSNKPDEANESISSHRILHAQLSTK